MQIVIDCLCIYDFLDRRVWKQDEAKRAASIIMYFEAMRAALPEMQVTNSLEDVVEFIYHAKGPGYFKEGSSGSEEATQ